MKKIIEQLNQSQQEAVTHVDGPMMVVAGAGSGKTRVLTYRVAYLIEQGADPFGILCLTFTNKAAREMKDRITGIVGGSNAKSVWMGTFHSVFARILRAEGKHLGYPANYTIYDTDDSKRLIRNIVKEMELDKKTYTANTVLHRISSAKSNLISAQEYNANPELTNQDKMAGKPYIGEIYNRYNLRLKKSAAMDFDDLLFNMNVLLRDFPKVLYKYQKRFKYILVDEYQDTNFAQYLIVKKMAADNENICVVGDDAQSIYAFRGANIENILNFKRDYPDLKTYKLEQNYRSTQNIVNAANSVIAQNQDQLQKEVWTENNPGEKLKLYKSATDQEEGMKIASFIFETAQNEKAKHKDFAVLYRTNAQSRAIEEALRKKNIPYRIYGGLSFYQRKEVKDLLAYFRLVVNLHDQDALLRVINMPARGIGNTSMDRIIVQADNEGKSVWEVCENITNSRVNLNSGIRNRIDNFVTMIKSFRTELKKKNAYELATRIARESGLMKVLNEDDSPEGMSRYENIEELLNAISLFVEQEDEEQAQGIVSVPGEEEQQQQEEDVRTLDKYMENIALITDADQDDQDQNKVSLMTIHGAKGLEFPYVFVAGLEENLFPSIQAMGTRAELEEERRLFYVAITRAERQAFLTYAETRRKWGNVIFSEASRFIDELDPQYVLWPEEEVSKGMSSTTEKPAQPAVSTQKPPDKKKLKKVKQTSQGGGNTSAANLDEIIVGATVEHAKFGQGKVIRVDGAGPNSKATVHFQSVGEKQLLLKFARLKVIG